ncbi:MAG: hypothetical protein AAFP90_11975 [Planctomycetota bacterium]
MPNLTEIWAQHGDQLRRRARTRLRQYGLAGQAESMDICNDVMAEMVRRDATAEVAPEALMTYILRAIDNQVLDTFRTLARQCRDFRRTDKTPVEDHGLIGGEPNEKTPSKVALRKEVLDLVRRQLGEDGVAIDMMLEGCGWAEIGRRLNVPADTARMRIRRGIKKIAEELGLSENDSDPN